MGKRQDKEVEGGEGWEGGGEQVVGIVGLPRGIVRRVGCYWRVVDAVNRRWLTVMAKVVINAVPRPFIT